MPMSIGERELLVRAQAVSVRLGRRQVLKDVDLAVAPGELVTLVGLNGSGKTTLVRVIVGLLEPDSGRVNRRAGLRVGFSPQHVGRDTTLPITARRFLTLGADAKQSRLQDLLDEVGVGGVLDRQLSDLSGGEFQRVVLSRALLREPDLLVLDKPMAGVDFTGQSDLYLLIISLLIIPAAAARRWPSTPEQMAVVSTVLGCVSVAGGLAASFKWDIPAGPSIVAAATALFVMFYSVPRNRVGVE